MIITGNQVVNNINIYSNIELKLLYFIFNSKNTGPLIILAIFIISIIVNKNNKGFDKR